MYRCCIKRTLYCILWPFGNTTGDVLTGKTETERKLKFEMQEDIENETGWDRVKKIFEKKYSSKIFNNEILYLIFCSEFGGLSPELSSITQVTWLSIFVGAVYGGIHFSREAYINFIKNNQATSFQNHFEAKVIYLRI